MGGNYTKDMFRQLESALLKDEIITALPHDAVEDTHLTLEDTHLTTYECYFDGSHRPQMSGCAFCVCINSQTIYKYVYHERLATSQLAEMRALYLLLKYIQQNIEPGSTLIINGDADGVIRKAEGLTKRSGKDGRTHVGKTRKLLRKLRKDYIITLNCIPRKENQTAHELVRIASFIAHHILPDTPICA